MDLFVGPIPLTTRTAELRKFLGALGEDAAIKVVRKQLEGAPYRYAVVRVPSEKLARKAIKRLNGKRLATTLVTVREYRHRASQNERRALNWRNQGWNGIERRRGERRQPDQGPGPSAKPGRDGYTWESDEEKLLDFWNIKSYLR